MYIISDEVLERSICSQCKKYLSVNPVKVYPNRAIKCGRCTEPFDAGIVSLFGLLAEKGLFRCVNRFEGCYQLLNYKGVAEHEKTCIGGLYECPTCLGSFTGTGYEIFMHFKELHQDNLLIDSSEFVLNLDNGQHRCYLHRKNDLLFFVSTSYYKSEREVILSVSYLGNDHDAAKIYQMFTLLSVDGKVIHKSKKKCCSSVTGRNTNYFNIVIEKRDFVKNVAVCKFQLTMEDLGTMLMLPRNLHDSTPFRFGSNNFESQGNSSNGSSFAKFDSNITVDEPFKGLNSEESKEGSPTISPIKKGIAHLFEVRTFGHKKTSNTSFRNKNKPNGIFCPVVSSDITIINGSEEDIVVTLQSITLMEKFKNLSFEELRLEYYQTKMEESKKNVYLYNNWLKLGNFTENN